MATSVISDPGSTHKAFTIGAALQEGVITRDSLITVGPGARPGRLPVRRHPPASSTAPS